VTAAALIREATIEDVEAIARVHVQAWRETYRALMPEALLAGLSVEQRAAMRTKVILKTAEAPCLWVSEDCGRIVGFGCIGKAHDSALGAHGEILAINFLADVKRRGLGTALFRHLLRLLKQRGYASAGLWVLSTNELARRFYEIRGGKQGTTRSVDADGTPLEEISYKWDLARLP
jgi:ribosomal protein S18 acetylase RimI-like enzyme